VETVKTCRHVQVITNEINAYGADKENYVRGHPGIIICLALLIMSAHGLIA
jgi:hypothetical protein